MNKKNVIGLKSDIPAVVLPSNITAAINAFQQAAIDYSWMGSQPPEEHEAIRDRYIRTKKRLRYLIKDIM